MSTEIELKLQLTPKTARCLPSHPLLAGIKPHGVHLLNTYYDTAKLALFKRRIALRFRKKGWQWLLTVKSSEPASGGLALRHEWEAPAHPGVFDLKHVDNLPLRAWLESTVPDLLPVFTTDFRRMIWLVSFGESVIELAFDRGRIECNGRSIPICEVELELVSGQMADIFSLTLNLQETLDLRPAVPSKAERGYALFAETAVSPFRARLVSLTPELTPVEAFRTIALGCLEHFQRNEPGLLTSDDPEYVHQARVALRRLRSAIKLFAPVLPPEFVITYSQTWQTLAGSLGDTRNWDVFVSETLPPLAEAFPQHPDVRRLQREGVKRARLARASVAHMLSLPEYPRLIVEFTAAVYALTDLLPQNLEEFARKRLQARARQARRLAMSHAELQPEDRHRMRICFKKLRYAVEFFSALLPPKRLKRYLTGLTQLQDELGLVNDHVTALTLLDEALHDRSPGPVHGWMIGRHELLVLELPDALNTWLVQKAPWK